MANQPSYDVFLSFQSKDIPKSFTDNLRKALNKRRINTFIDVREELSEVDEIPLALSNVIQQCRVAIIVLSENYAESSLCLEELAFIHDNFQQNHSIRFIFPVYYMISPSKVRKQYGAYEKAFASHEVRLGENNEKLHRWREALNQIGLVSGWNIGETDEFNKVINQIVEVVSRKFDPVPTIWQRVFNANTMWRQVGFVSGVLGLICYFFSPSFDRLIGIRKPNFKFILYGMLCLAIIATILFGKKQLFSTQHLQLKTYTRFAVLMIISVYSFFYDRAVNGKPDILSVVSNAAFALMSLSMHKIFTFQSEIGIFSYFLGTFTIQLLTINRMLVFVAIFYNCLLFVNHLSSNDAERAAGNHHSSSNDAATRLAINDVERGNAA